MRIVFLSDLHIDVPKVPLDNRTAQLLNQIYNLKPDYLILGGDIIDFHKGWELFLETWTAYLPDTKLCIVLGNHDLWSFSHQEFNLEPFTRENVYDHVYAACQKYGAIFLEEEPIVAGDKLLCGSIAWYDYSVRPITVNKEYLSYNKKKVNNDGTYIQSKIGDEEYANICLKRLKKNIAKHTKRVNDIYVFTHVPVLKECIVAPPSGQRAIEWEMSNAYFFNTTIGDMLCKNKKVKLIVSGHIHRYCHGVLRNGIEYATCGSDYNKPELLVIDVNDENKITIENVLT